MHLIVAIPGILTRLTASATELCANGTNDIMLVLIVDSHAQKSAISNWTGWHGLEQRVTHEKVAGFPRRL